MSSGDGANQGVDRSEGVIVDWVSSHQKIKNAAVD